MVSFYTPGPRQAQRTFELCCSELDLRCRGVGRSGGKVWFCEGLLPGEMAEVRPGSSRSAEAVLVRRLNDSAQRREPDCPQQHFCGGCPLQYIPPELALESKCAGIRRLFKRSCGVDLGESAFVVHSPEYGYRRACRLSARRDHGRMHLGFREGKSHKLAEFTTCPVLTPRLQALLLPLGQLVNQLEARFNLGHAELLDSDDQAALNLRFGCQLDEADCCKLKEFAASYECLVTLTETLQAGGNETLERLIAGEPECCVVHSGGLGLCCLPSDFVQINQQAGPELTARVLEALQGAPGRRILDLYCGLGYFTLPLAAAGAQVCGVDIVRAMIKRAQENAARLGLGSAEFICADLAVPFSEQDFAKKDYDAVLLDPGRSGAAEAAAYILERKIRRVVLVSCNPRAAARDSALWFHAGWRVRSWGVFDMFPRTSHIEMLLNLEL